jgi:hypothetical protein
MIQDLPFFFFSILYRGFSELFGAQLNCFGLFLMGNLDSVILLATICDSAKNYGVCVYVLCCDLHVKVLTTMVKIVPWVCTPKPDPACLGRSHLVISL